MPRLHLSRRALLRGLGGVAIGLPLLDIMTERPAHAATPSGRFLLAFAGLSLGRHDGELFTPPATGLSYDLPRSLQPLAGHGNVRKDISVVSNLTIPWSDGQGVPPGGRAEKFHASSLGPLLSGVRSQDEVPRALGATADQKVADVLGKATRFRSIEARVQAQGYGGGGLGGAAGGIQSYRAGPQGQVLPNPPIASPKLLFDMLFSGAQETQARLRDRSVLDVVLEESERLRTRLGGADRQRLERHFDEIRELEKRTAALPLPTGGACLVPGDPGADPPETFGYSDEATRAGLLGELLRMAFVCDLTPVATLMYTWVQCFMNAKPIAGVETDLHELGHSAGTLEQMADATAWVVDHFAKLVASFRDTPDGDGTLLDRSALVLVFEGGSGYDSESGAARSSHSTEKMAALVAGRAGGLNPAGGRHIATKGAHPARVILAAMHAVGVEGPLGEVSGVVEDLFG